MAVLTKALAPSCKYAGGMKTEPHGILFDPRYVDLLDGDIPAALILSQIAYWYRPGKKGKSKLRVYHHGVYWLAKSAADWKIELGLSAKQAYRSINALKAKGLIQTKVMKFNGTPTTHIRLDTDALNEALGSVLTKSICDLATSSLGGKHQFNFASKPHPFPLEGKSLTETTTETTTENTLAADAAEPSMMVSKTIKAVKQKQNIEEENMAVEKQSSANGNQIPVAALATLWQKHMALNNPGIQKTFTNKEYGQLKQLRNKLGKQSPDVLAFVLENWGKFVWQAQGDKGLSTAPGIPVVGFVLAHFEVAMQLIAQPVQAKPALTLVPTHEHQVPNLSCKPAEQAPLAAEQQALLEYFQKTAQMANGF